MSSPARGGRVRFVPGFVVFCFAASFFCGAGLPVTFFGPGFLAAAFFAVFALFAFAAGRFRERFAEAMREFSWWVSIDRHGQSSPRRVG